VVVEVVEVVVVGEAVVEGPQYQMKIIQVLYDYVRFLFDYCT
jgi:hypothetical protein